MKANDYKKHFLGFVSQVYPNGLPEGDVIITIACDDVVYNFPVDAEDYAMFMSAGKKTKISKDKFTTTDKDWLKMMRILVPDGD